MLLNQKMLRKVTNLTKVTELFLLPKNSEVLLKRRVSLDKDRLKMLNFKLQSLEVERF